MSRTLRRCHCGDVVHDGKQYCSYNIKILDEKIHYDRNKEKKEYHFHLFKYIDDIYNI